MLSPPVLLMIISQIYYIFFYLISLILFLNFRSPFIFWVVTELNLLLFILLMYNDLNEEKQEYHDLILFYFIVQSLSSIFILRDFFFSLDFFIFNSDLIFLLAILIKLAIFPFFYWIFKISNFLNIYSLTALLSLQKLPFFLVFFSSQRRYFIILILMSFLRGSFLILFRNNFINILICSSITYRFWTFYLYTFNFYLFILFFIIYMIVIFLFLSRYNMKDSNNVFIIFLFIFFLGLSPLRLLFFKFIVVSHLAERFRLNEVLFFWFFRFLTLFGYIKFSYKSFFYKFYLYTLSVGYTIKSFFFFFSTIFFFFFFYY